MSAKARSRATARLPRPRRKVCSLSLQGDPGQRCFLIRGTSAGSCVTFEELLLTLAVDCGLRVRRGQEFSTKESGLCTPVTTVCRTTTSRLLPPERTEWFG